MKMTDKAVCCDQCYHLIASQSVSCSNLWLKFIDFHKSLGIFACDFGDHEDVRLLELNGFIVTTENDKLTIVKVLGFTKDSVGEYYCCKGCYDRD
jgi:hypothetical protein